MPDDDAVTEQQVSRVRTVARLMWLASFVLLMIGIGGFGTASSGHVEMLGVDMEAKYACFIYFVLGGLFVWTTLEARRRGLR